MRGAVGRREEEKEELRRRRRRKDGKGGYRNISEGWEWEEWKVRMGRSGRAWKGEM